MNSNSLRVIRDCRLPSVGGLYTFYFLLNPRGQGETPIIVVRAGRLKSQNDLMILRRGDFEALLGDLQAEV